jgi:hypothetical protein
MQNDQYPKINERRKAMYVYRKSRHEQLYTVGFYDPSGAWEPESDHRTEDAAAARVHYLNGGEERQAARIRSSLEAEARANNPHAYD